MTDLEIQALQDEVISLKSAITPDERLFVLDLIREARVYGITELTYKGLKLTISPQAAERAASQTYFTSNGAKVPQGWETTIPKAR